MAPDASARRPAVRPSSPYTTNGTTAGGTSPFTRTFRAASGSLAPRRDLNRAIHLESQVPLGEGFGVVFKELFSSSDDGVDRSPRVDIRCQTKSQSPPRCARANVPSASGPSSSTRIHRGVRCAPVRWMNPGCVLSRFLQQRKVLRPKVLRERV